VEEEGAKGCIVFSCQIKKNDGGFSGGEEKDSPLNRCPPERKKDVVWGTLYCCPHTLSLGKKRGGRKETFSTIRWGQRKEGAIDVEKRGGQGNS